MKKFVLESSDRVHKVRVQLRKNILLIFGSRDYTPDGEHLEFFLKDVLTKLPGWPNEWVVMSGGASGVDSWAETLAKSFDINFIEFPALWNKLGIRAGFSRNNEMVACKPHFSVAFHKGFSNGTMDTIEKLRLEKLEGIVFNVDTDKLCVEQIQNYKEPENDNGEDNHWY